MIRFGSGKKLEEECLRYEPVLSGNIAVTGTGRGVGATTVALMLAGVAAEHGEAVSFTECQDPSQMARLVYHILSMDKRRGTPVSIYGAAAEGLPVRIIENRMMMEAGQGHIDWRIVTPDDVNEAVRLDKAQMTRIVSSAGGDVCIFDVSSDGSTDHLFSDMDLVVAVVDPLPSRLLMQASRIASIKYIKNKGIPVVFVVNRINKGVSKRHVKRIIRDPDIIFIDMIDETYIYAAEFGGLFPWEQPAAADAAAVLFTEISRWNKKVIGR